MRENADTTTGCLRFECQDSFAAFSMPGSTDFKLVFQYDQKDTADYSDEIGYFIIHPYTLAEKKARYIRAEQVLTNPCFDFDPDMHCDIESTAQHQYLDDVSSILREINSETYQKLVYSRVIKVPKSDLSLYGMFTQMLRRYPSAFVFCYYTPSFGCWMGATPELLIRDEDDYYRTIALAGTQVDIGMPLDQIVWPPKEQEEQYFLRDFIQNQLDAIHIKYHEHHSKTVKAGNLLHIATEFRIDKSLDMLQVAKLLHPGPAICGTPQQLAYDYIAEYESHERKNYCGFIGPVDISGVSALYVNLRSMQVFKDHMLLYVGGGITKDSQPQDEWDETQNKSLTLLDVIQKCDK